MKNTLQIFLILFFGICNNITGQNEGFRMMSTHKSYEDIRFQFINNLIVIPIKVNNKKLNFILGSGVNKTIVFNSSKVDTILSNFE